MFNKANSNILPPQREGVDHKINLEPGTRPENLHYSPLYKISLEELKACWEYVLDNLQKGFIVFSNTL